MKLIIVFTLACLGLTLAYPLLNYDGYGDGCGVGYGGGNCGGCDGGVYGGLDTGCNLGCDKGIFRNWQLRKALFRQRLRLNLLSKYCGGGCPDINESDCC